MEEEKKEEVKVEEQTTTVKTLEEKDEKYLKLKKSNNRKKALIVILLFTLVLAGILIFLLLCQKEKEEPKKPENNQQEDQPKAKEEYIVLKKGTNVNFELRSYNNEPDTSPDIKLYVNNKLIDNKVVEDIHGLYEVYEVDDILVVLVSFDNSFITFLNSNGEKIGTFSSRFGSVEFKGIIGNEIYVKSYISSVIHQDLSSICEYSNNEIVEVEERMTYLGNNKFSAPKTISQKTQAEYAKENGIDCSKNVH